MDRNFLVRAALIVATAVAVMAMCDNSVLRQERDDARASVASCRGGSE